MSKNQNTLLYLLLAGGAVYLWWKSQGGSLADKRQYLLTWVQGSTGDTAESKAAMTAIVNQFTDQELNDVYEFIHNYAVKGLQVPAGSGLQLRLAAISSKYNIFT